MNRQEGSKERVCCEQEVRSCTWAEGRKSESGYGTYRDLVQ